MKKSGLKKFICVLAGVICALLLAEPAFFGTELYPAAQAAEGYEEVANWDEMGAVMDVVRYGMTPIYGQDIADGTYVVDTICSSRFFRIMEAKVTVEDGEMTAVLTMSSRSYSYVYPGTPEEAAAAPLEDYIPLEDDGERYTFTIPVSEFNGAVSLSAFSVRKEKWYGRQIVFEAASLPQSALPYPIPDYERIAEAVEFYDEENGTDSMGELYAGLISERASLEDEPSAAVAVEEGDGTYSIDVDMTGGSGRASVTSPTWLVVEDGHGYAKLLWSSPYYDYMIVGNERYENLTTDGSNSTFLIPITKLDEPMRVIADTTAMGDPLEIEYELTFYADSIGGRGRVPQEAAKTVIVVALCIMVGGGIANHFVQKKRRR